MLLRWNSGVGGQRKPVNPGSAGARACRKCFDITKAHANPSTFLSGPFPKGDTLCDSGRSRRYLWLEEVEVARGSIYEVLDSISCPICLSQNDTNILSICDR